jgi:collagenase-like PrtC family protease
MPINYELMITPETKQAASLAAAVAIYRKAIQSLIDGKAQAKQYDDGNSLASYVNSTVPEWAAEAQTFVAWRDQVWAYALAELAKVQKAEREQPSVEGFLAELPAFEWPSELVTDA